MNNALLHAIETAWPEDSPRLHINKGGHKCFLTATNGCLFYDDLNALETADMINAAYVAWVMKAEAMEKLKESLLKMENKTAHNFIDRINKCKSDYKRANESAAAWLDAAKSLAGVE